MSGRLVNVRPKPGFALDAAGAIVPSNVVPLRDGALLNVLTGRGTSVDRGAHNFWHRRFTTHQQIEAAYLGSWIHRKVVDIVAEDMTRAGRDWDAEDDDIEAIEAEERRLGYWPKLREALRLGRLGGGAIFIGLGDADPMRELPAKVNEGAIQYLTVFSRWQLTLGEIETDPASPNFNQPRYFEINGLGRALRIHPSRMVCFHGLPIPSLYQTTADDRFWGMSVVEAIDEAVQNATTATAGFASLIDEAKVDVFTMPGMYETLAQPGGETKFMAALQAAAQGKSIHRMLALGEGETWETRQLTWAGMPDIIATYMSMVAGAADIPATRLLGKSPDGQNSTGASDLTNYYQGVSARQEMSLRPAMERLDAVMLPSAGVSGTNLSWAFSSLMVLSEKELAEIEWQEAQAVEKYVNTGLFEESAMAETVANRLTESQRWPGFAAALAKAEAAGEDLPGDPDELDIVPIPGQQQRGGDPQVSAGARGSNGSEPRRRAANDTRFLADAEPKTLYISRKVLNAAEIIRWAKGQGLETTLPAEDMHVTVAFSRTPVDWFAVGADWSGDEQGRLRIKPGGPRTVERLGDGDAVALLFADENLTWRHERIKSAGASWDWPEYRPHITLSWNADGVDVDALEPYTGPIVLGPELFAELDLDWKSKVKEG